MTHFLRRRYFIDKQLQTKYIVLTILLLLLYSLLFVVILFFPFIVRLSFDYPVEEQTRAARMLLNLHVSVWPAIGSVILILSALSVFVTHKMAGPMYRFRQVLGEVNGGNLDVSVRLRRKDDFHDLAEDMNKVITSLRDVAHTLHDADQVMAAYIIGLEEQVSNNQISDETRNKLIKKMQASRDNIAQALQKYSIKA